MVGVAGPDSLYLRFQIRKRKVERYLTSSIWYLKTHIGVHTEYILPVQDVSVPVWIVVGPWAPCWRTSYIWSSHQLNPSIPPSPFTHHTLYINSSCREAWITRCLTSVSGSRLNGARSNRLSSVDDSGWIVVGLEARGGLAHGLTWQAFTVFGWHGWGGVVDEAMELGDHGISARDKTRHRCSRDCSGYIDGCMYMCLSKNKKEKR